LFVVVDDAHLGGVGFWLGHGDRGRIGHCGHSGGWHHQSRHDVIIKRVRTYFGAFGLDRCKQKLELEVRR